MAAWPGGRGWACCGLIENGLRSTGNTQLLAVQSSWPSKASPIGTNSAPARPAAAAIVALSPPMKPRAAGTSASQSQTQRRPAGGRSGMISG